MDANFFRMLVLKAKTIKIEGAVRSIFRLIILKRRDKLFTAAGITGHRIDGRGMIRRDKPSASPMDEVWRSNHRRSIRDS